MSDKFITLYKNERVEFQLILIPIKYWKYFHNFYLLPTLYIGSMNTYNGGKYLFTRIISLYFLWWEIGFVIKYGIANKN